MEQIVVYIGMDVHKETISFAGYIGDEPNIRFEKKIPNDKTLLKKEFVKISKHGEINCCYEAGFCGFDLYRYIASLGYKCSVIAPSLIPQKQGDKVKTDKRDAKKLAMLFRAGLLTDVNVPSIESEKDRSLVRMRAQYRKDTTRAKHRILKFLQINGIKYGGKTHWTLAHRQFLREIELDPQNQFVLSQYMTSLDYLESRLKEIDERIEQLALSSKYREKVGALKCFRGVDTLTAMTILTEIEYILRFSSPQSFMNYIGLTPSEHSSGENIYRGNITKHGNRRLRHIFIEAAWHYLKRPEIGPALKKRFIGQDTQVINMSIKAIKRLNKRFYSIIIRKEKSVAVVAVARELAGFIWAALREVELKSA